MDSGDETRQARLWGWQDLFMMIPCFRCGVWRKRPEKASKGIRCFVQGMNGGHDVQASDR